MHTNRMSTTPTCSSPELTHAYDWYRMLFFFCLLYMNQNSVFNPPKETPHPRKFNESRPWINNGWTTIFGFLLWRASKRSMFFRGGAVKNFQGTWRPPTSDTTCRPPSIIGPSKCPDPLIRKKKDTPLKTVTCPLKSDHFSREYIFQPSIFRGHVSFQGSKASSPSNLATKNAKFEKDQPIQRVQLIWKHFYNMYTLGNQCVSEKDSVIIFGKGQSSSIILAGVKP